MNHLGFFFFFTNLLVWKYYINKHEDLSFVFDYV